MVSINQSEQTPTTVKNCNERETTKIIGFDVQSMREYILLASGVMVMGGDKIRVLLSRNRTHRCRDALLKFKRCQFGEK